MTAYKFLFSVIIITLFLVPPTFAQSVDTIWTKTFGGTGAEYGYDVQQTTDNGYILTGSTPSFGAGYDDVWLIKTDGSGNETFNKTFGGSLWDIGRAVQQTSDGGYIIVGDTRSQGGGLHDIWLIKTNSSGDSSWAKLFGGSNDEFGYSVKQTTDGGYIIAGGTKTFGAGYSDVWLIKTDGSGNSTWTKTFGGNQEDIAYSVLQTSDGGYLLTGSTESFGAGNKDVWLLKTNASGDSSWAKTFGGNMHDYGNEIRKTTDGGYIITGATYSYGLGSSDLWLIKTDGNGDSLWAKTYGYSGFNNEEGFSVQQTADSGYIITGIKMFAEGRGGDVWLLKADASGDTLWTKTYGISASMYTESGRSVQQNNDNSFIILGYTNSFGAGSSDFWLLKTGPDISVTEESSKHLSGLKNPNLVRGDIMHLAGIKVNVAVKIHDILGREVLSQIITPQKAYLRLNKLTSGIYFLSFEGEAAKVRKFVLIR